MTASNQAAPAASCASVGDRLPIPGWWSNPVLPPRRGCRATRCNTRRRIVPAACSGSVCPRAAPSAFAVRNGLVSSNITTATASPASCALFCAPTPARGLPRRGLAILVSSQATSDGRGSSDVASSSGDVANDGAAPTASAPDPQQQQQQQQTGRGQPEVGAEGERTAVPVTPKESSAAAGAAADGASAAAGAGTAPAAPADAAAAKPAVQSEYVEEYETVYETETEEAAAAATAGAREARAAEAAEGSEAAEARTVGVGSTEAVVETRAVAAADPGVALRHQTTLWAVEPPPLASLPYGGVSRLPGGVGGLGGGGFLGGTSVGGWALAAALLFAIRLSRREADAERLDLEALQAQQAEGRALDSELRARRRAYLEEERRRLEEEAEKRVAEARARQEEEARLTAERQRQWQEEAAREAQRMQEAAAAARRVYEEREARLDEELAARAEVERRLREEAEARRREEAEAKKRAEAEAAQRAAELRAAAAAAEAARRAEEEAARREAERRLRLASTWYTLVFRGRVSGRPAPPGTTLPPSGGGGAALALLRGPVAARIVLECSAELSYVARTAPTLTAAADVAADVAAAVEAAAAEGAAAAATLAVPATEISSSPAAAGSGDGGDGAATDAPAVVGTSGRQYESAAAAVEGAAELAGAASGPLAALLSRPTWLGALPLQPPPLEALRSWVGESEGAEGQEAAAAAAGEAASTGGGSVVADSELRHWSRMAHLQLLTSCRQLVCQLAPLLGPGEELEQEFQCRISRQVPPPTNTLPAAVGTAVAATVLPPAVAPTLRRAAAAAAAGQLQLAVDFMNGAIAREEVAAAAGRDGAANGAALPPLAVAALLYGEMMEAAGYEPPPPPPSPPASAEGAPADVAEAEGRVGEGPAEEGAAGEGTAAASTTAASLERLARYQLAERAKVAPPDSLTVTAQLLRRVLPGGPRHAVSRILDQLAEANLSPSTRQVLQIRRQRAALEAQAAAVLQQQRGDGAGGALEVGPGGAADTRGSLVPVPERLWATRNVANNLMRFGEPLQVGEAVSMLEEAVSLARRHYGPRHPSQLGVLLDYLDALEAEERAQQAAAAAAGAAGAVGAEQQPAAAGADAAASSPSVSSRRAVAAAELVEVAQVLCERYQAARDPLSCVLLLEAALVEAGPALRPTGQPARGGAGGAGGRGRGAAALAAASELAGELMYALKPPEARTVMTVRRDGALSGLLRRLARDFTEELAAYGKKRNRWVDAFNKGAPLPPLRPQ